MRLPNGKKPPLVRHALEGMLAAVLELEPRAGGEVLDGARDEHLSGRRFCQHALAEVHGDPCDPLVKDLDLAGVQSGTDLDPKLANRVAQNAGAPDGARGAVEQPRRFRRSRTDAHQASLSCIQALRGPLSRDPGTRALVLMAEIRCIARRHAWHSW